MIRLTKLNLFVLFVIAMSIISCGLAQQRQDVQPKPAVLATELTTPDQNIPDSKKDWLDYWPAVVQLKGKLAVKTFFGPPNFGENPKTDTKEAEWILVVDTPVNVRGNTGPTQSPSDELSVENVHEMELVLTGKHNELKGKKVLVTGTLFHAHTGHHHTDVLMDVQSISRDQLDKSLNQIEVRN